MVEKVTALPDVQPPLRLLSCNSEQGAKALSEALGNRILYATETAVEISKDGKVASKANFKAYKSGKPDDGVPEWVVDDPDGNGELLGWFSSSNPLDKLRKTFKNRTDIDWEKFAADFPNSKDLDKFVEQPELVEAWKVLDDANSPLKTNIDELTDVSKHLDDINSYSGGYIKWKIDNDEAMKISSIDILDEVLKRGVQDKIIGDYSIDMISNKIGSNYIVNGFNINLVDGANESITGIKNVLKSLEIEAINSGAKIFTFRLHSIKNKSFLSPRLWGLLGYTFKNEGGAIILVSKLL